ncbi:MAG: ADP-L-glycero-D-manno-heptose-6-epimerase [Fibrobacteres bacterium]|nr:ADP-L-glycero-D-manno-heptose-6-epimerase [Fibrobacterota bacterium]
MGMQKPIIIITGAAGFIGSALAWRLNQQGENNLLLVDELGKSSKWKNLVPIAYHDYMDKADFIAAVSGGRLDTMEIRAVLHMGACSSTTETDAAYLAKNNFEYSKILADWCLRRSIRFVYASSAATYGDGKQGYRDDHVLLPALRPLNPYGYSKHMFDLWNLKRGHLDRVVGLKFFNVFGPNEYHKEDMRSMVVKAFEQIKDSGRVKLFKSHRTDYRDGQQLRDFLYVKDAIDMTLFFLDPSRPGGIYNVGTGQTRSWMDLATALFRTLGREPKVDFIPMPESIRDKYQYQTKAELSKIRAIGYDAPILSLEEGIQDYVPYLEGGFKNLGWA